MSSAQPTDPAAAGAAPLRAGVVVAGKPGSYEMFEVRALRVDGARLGGALLPELEEELTLRIGAGAGSLNVHARVTQVDRGADRAGDVEVTFLGVTAADRQRLEALVLQAG